MHCPSPNGLASADATPALATWSRGHHVWINSQRFDEAAATVTFDHYRAVLTAREAAVVAIEADLLEWATREPFAEIVTRFGAYRGVTALGGVVLASEVFDWHRFPTAGMFMSFTGLTPSEHSSGETQRRGGITHAGNAHLRTQLVESAWAYRSAALVGAGLRKRQEGVHPDTIARSWKAQQRLCTRYRRLDRLVEALGLTPDETFLAVGRAPAAAAPIPRRHFDPLCGSHRPKCGATRCATLFCGPDPRTSVWRPTLPRLPGPWPTPHEITTAVSAGAGVT